MVENKDMVTTLAPLDPDVDVAGLPLPVRVPEELDPDFPDGVGVAVEVVTGRMSVYKSVLLYV
jgi:hypothetical protein